MLLVLVSVSVIFNRFIVLSDHFRNSRARSLEQASLGLRNAGIQKLFVFVSPRPSTVDKSLSIIRQRMELDDDPSILYSV